MLPLRNRRALQIAPSRLRELFVTRWNSLGFETFKSAALPVNILANWSAPNFRLLACWHPYSKVLPITSNYIHNGKLSRPPPIHANNGQLHCFKRKHCRDSLLESDKASRKFRLARQFASSRPKGGFQWRLTMNYSQITTGSECSRTFIELQIHWQWATVLIRSAFV